MQEKYLADNSKELTRKEKKKIECAPMYNYSWTVYDEVYWTWVPPEKCCCSVAKSCLTLCDPMDCSTPGFPVLHYLPEFAQTHVHWVCDSIQPSHPLSSPSLPSIFPSIRVFSNESSLPIKWPKYLSFSFNISPSNEHSIGISNIYIQFYNLKSPFYLHLLLYLSGFSVVYHLYYHGIWLVGFSS